MADAWPRGESVFHGSSDFLVFALFGESLGSLLRERRFFEDVAGEAGIVLTSFVEDLNGAAAVVFPGDLKRRPNAVFQLVIRVDGNIFVDLLGFFVLGDDGAANQEMSGTINGKAELALL